MSRLIRCPKCGSEMRKGELFITVTSSDGQFMSSPLERTPTGYTFSMPAMATGAGPFWRERVGEKKGELPLRSQGLRCTACGYIELYAPMDQGKK